jgi:hypothetical protein
MKDFAIFKTKKIGDSKNPDEMTKPLIDLYAALESYNNDEWLI